MNSTVNLIARPPAAELVDGIAALIRTGLPPLLESPAWAKGDPAPAGHWLVPAGTRIFPYHQQAKAESPCIIIGQAGKASKIIPNSLLLWKIPITATIMLAKGPGADGGLALTAKLLRLLTETIPTGNPGTKTPWERLTAASMADSEAASKQEYLFAMPRGLEDVDVHPLEDDGKGHAELTFTLTVNCATATQLPAAA